MGQAAPSVKRSRARAATERAGSRAAPSTGRATSGAPATRSRSTSRTRRPARVSTAIRRVRARRPPADPTEDRRSIGPIRSTARPDRSSTATTSTRCEMRSVQRRAGSRGTATCARHRGASPRIRRTFAFDADARIAVDLDAATRAAMPPGFTGSSAVAPLRRGAGVRPRRSSGNGGPSRPPVRRACRARSSRAADKPAPAGSRGASPRSAGRRR